MSNKLLALDLSTTCTGVAIFDIKTKKLEKYYSIKPNTKGMSKLETLEIALNKIEDLTSQLSKILKDLNPELIIIEQINRGVNRLSQKTLDIMHGSLLFEIRKQKMLNKINFVDSSAWRKGLGIRLSDEDKKHNKNIRKTSKKDKRLKLEVINWKTLAVRYVNEHFKLQLDDKNHDTADSICVGYYFLTKVMK